MPILSHAHDNYGQFCSKKAMLIFKAAFRLSNSTLIILPYATIFCLKELKEDPKTSTCFKNHTGVLKDMGKDWEIQKVIKNVSTGQFITLASRVTQIKVSQFPITFDTKALLLACLNESIPHLCRKKRLVPIVNIIFLIHWMAYRKKLPITSQDSDKCWCWATWIWTAHGWKLRLASSFGYLAYLIQNCLHNFFRVFR